MNICRLLIGSFFLLCSCGDCYAQVGRDSTLWTWTTNSSHHNGIVNVSLDGASGTGIIISVDREKPVKDGFQGFCLTAHHVVESDNGRRAIKVRYQNGRSASRCKVLISDDKLDVAILWVWVPEDIDPVSLGTIVEYGDEVEFAGLGGTTDPNGGLRSFTARASAPTNNKTIYADVSLLPGDSGGPVFNQKQEVVGVISGGWFWWNGGILTDAGNPIKTTWPARAANVKVITELVAQVATKSSVK